MPLNRTLGSYTETKVVNKIIFLLEDRWLYRLFKRIQQIEQAVSAEDSVDQISSKILSQDMMAKIILLPNKESRQGVEYAIRKYQQNV